MKVIAYLHTHWDREWYREFEIFRLRLLRVFDNVLEMLSQNKIPSFYFDGQTCALEDYLKLRPEKEKLIKSLIKDKKLFIGPFYTLVDEFLTDEICFRQNLKIGLDFSKKMGCEDFIGYFADTFGHSQAVPLILKEFDINKAVVWRGCPDFLPSEFVFNGINTVNLIRGYFNDIFSTNLSIKKKAEFLQTHLEKIKQKSDNVLLMPIGADHLGIPKDISHQIKEVNKYLDNFEIVLSNPFEYFKLVKNNFKTKYNDELRDNSQTFILQGSYSARADIKRNSAEASYLLNKANKLVQLYNKTCYNSAIEYAYKLLLKNLAHDGICGCSTDDVHNENLLRYKKIKQISKTIIKEITLNFEKNEISDKNFSGFLYQLSNKKEENISSEITVEDELWYDTQKIPVTEDFKPIYKNILCYQNGEKDTSDGDLKISDKKIENSKIALEIANGEINVIDKISNKTYTGFFTLWDRKDLGDTYNFAPDKNDLGQTASIITSKTLHKGNIQNSLNIKMKLKGEIFNVEVSLNKFSHLLHFKINWTNRHKNHLLQAKFKLRDNATSTLAQSMGYLFERKFNPNYDLKQNLPDTKGIEAKTNTAPFQKYLWCQGIEFITNGIFEYEVYKNTLSLSILRAIGIISNPKNPARLTPAGPPIRLKDAQLLGKNTAEFHIGFTDNPINQRVKTLNEIFPDVVIYHQD